MDFSFDNVFKKVIDIVFSIILLALILAMAIGAVKLFQNIWNLFFVSGITGRYLDLITDILTLFVLVELSRSLVDYFHVHRLRMTFIVDAAIVFFIREVMIMTFQHKITASDTYAMSALLLVLTVLRIGSIVMFQRELKVASIANTGEADS